MTTTDDAGDRVLAIVTHILGYLTSFLGPLIVLFAAERESAKQHARRALNWQLSLILYSVLLGIAMAVSIPLMIIGIGFLTFVLAIIAMIALSIADLVFVIIAAVRASEDRLYEYPLTVRFVKDPVRAKRRSTGIAPEASRPNTSTAKQASPKRSASSTKRSSKSSGARASSKRPKSKAGSAKRSKK